MSDHLRRWLRDPLLHFIVIGVALFALLPRGEDISSQRIDVSRVDLIGFLQSRARIYDDRTFAEAYDALSPAERAQLLRDFVRQEALYREARAIRLDEADPLVRGRLVQQMELMLRDGAQGGDGISEEEVQSWFDQHRGDYSQPATVSFTHVFLDRERHGGDTRALAETQLRRLQQNSVAPEDAIQHGDRFPYQRNYSDMAANALVPELGSEVTNAVFAVPPNQWSGPFASPLGYHLVRVIDRRESRTPELATIRALVTEDALRAKRSELGEAAIQRVLNGYHVVPAGDVGALAP